MIDARGMVADRAPVEFIMFISNYTGKWNTDIGIYIYVYEIYKSNSRVKASGSS